MTELRVLPPAAKFLKKLKDNKLKSLYKDAIDAILDSTKLPRQPSFPC
jgi:mRNA-degrading endonuclease RelE of RelBE toxin-antitoxin system